MMDIKSEFFIKHGAWVYDNFQYDKNGKLVWEGVEFLSVKIPQEIYRTTLKWKQWEKMSLKENGKWIDVIVKINKWV